MSARLALAAAGLVLAGALPAFAQTADVGAFAQVRDASPLTLGEVLASTDRHHPLIEGAAAQVEAAEGALLGAQGAFDPTLNLNLTTNAFAGYYSDNVRGSVSVEQTTPLWGTKIFAGYRLSRGALPVYYEFDRTLNGGEFFAGAMVPILRDGAIDYRRLNRARAEFGQQQAEAERDAKRLAVRLKATEAYAKWVAAAYKLAVVEQILELTEFRQRAVEQRVGAGSLAPISNLEARRQVLSWRTKRVEARNKLQETSLMLGLYVRADDGTPAPPHRGRAPTDLADLRGEGPSLDEALERAVAIRPELVAIEQEIAAYRVTARHARNQRLPRLDASFYVRHDLGDAVPGDPDNEEKLTETLDPTEIFLGLNVEVPIPGRQPRGRAEQYEALVTYYETQAQWVREQVRADVRRVHVALELAEERYELARESAEVLEALTNGERTRFDAGATTLLVVNIRERSLTDARATLASAWADWLTARAAWDALLGAGVIE
ncbi:MAG: TolC family protein [Myxococcota bacterium]